VRMPHHPELLSLLERTGPLACTSANITGEPTPSAVSDIAKKLDGVALYVDGGASTLDHGSTIVDLTGTKPQIIREGPIGADAVYQAIAAG
jgi:L-threonylcarbamoyladenylate synthase